MNRTKKNLKTSSLIIIYIAISLILMSVTHAHSVSVTDKCSYTATEEGLGGLTASTSDAAGNTYYARRTPAGGFDTVPGIEKHNADCTFAKAEAYASAGVSEFNDIQHASAPDASLWVSGFDTAPSGVNVRRVDGITLAEECSYTKAGNFEGSLPAHSTDSGRTYLASTRPDGNVEFTAIAFAEATCVEEGTVVVGGSGSDGKPLIEDVKKVGSQVDILTSYRKQIGSDFKVAYQHWKYDTNTQTWIPDGAELITGTGAFNNPTALAVDPELADDAIPIVCALAEEGGGDMLRGIGLTSATDEWNVLLTLTTVAGIYTSLAAADQHCFVNEQGFVFETDQTVINIAIKAFEAATGISVPGGLKIYQKLGPPESSPEFVVKTATKTTSADVNDAFSLLTFNPATNSFSTTHLIDTFHFGTQQETVCGNNIIETGEQCDDGNIVNGDCCSSTCQFESPATQCRASAGECDQAEFCTGTSGTCPADEFKPSTLLCRPATGTCDLDEFCTGSSPTCPPDIFNDGFQEPCIVPGLFGPCANGVKTCSNGQFGPCQQTVFPTQEGPSSSTTCTDGTDNDCDGLTDTQDPDCQAEACTTEVRNTVNVVGKGQPYKQLPLVNAKVNMPTKGQVHSACQNLLDANCFWTAFPSGATGSPVVFKDSTGKATATSSLSDPDGWVIEEDATGASIGTIGPVTGGSVKIALANTDCAPQKHIQWIAQPDGSGGFTITPARVQHQTGSLLTILSPEQAEWDTTSNSYLYPFIFTSDSNWNVDVCAQVPVGYDIIGVYDAQGQLVQNNNCMQTFVTGETKVIAFEVAKTGSPPSWNFNAKLNFITPKGTYKKLDVSIPTHVPAAEKAADPAKKKAKGIPFA